MLRGRVAHGPAAAAATARFARRRGLDTDSIAANPDLLRAIAAEERVHDVPLWQLRAGFPDLTPGEHMLAATQHLHLMLSAGGPAQHFARFASLDSALCLVLGRMLRQGTPMSPDRVSATVLHRIQQDEVR